MHCNNHTSTKNKTALHLHRWYGTCSAGLLDRLQARPFAAQSVWGSWSMSTIGIRMANV